MFISLKNILPRALEKNKVNTEIKKIEKKEQAQKVLQKIIGEGAEIIRCDGTLVIRVRHHAVANEIVLRERQIKGQLKEEGIIVTNIKCA